MGRRGPGPVTATLAERQFALIPWQRLRAGGGMATRVGDDLRMLMFAGVESDDGSEERLENEVESQGHLFECAPAVVSVIVAGVVEGVVPPASRAPCLDLLGRVLGGQADESEVDRECADLRALCRYEAMRGYWGLMRAADERDPYDAWRTAVAVLRTIDDARALLGS